MKKNFDNIFSTIEIDPATDRYHITVPEEIINELDWYEETKINDVKITFVPAVHWSKRSLWDTNKTLWGM